MQACLEMEKVSIHWLAQEEIKIVFWIRYQAILIPKPLNKKLAENSPLTSKISIDLSSIDYPADGVHWGRILDVG